MKMLNTFVQQGFSENYLLDLLFKSEKRKLESSIKVLSRAEKYLLNRKKEIGDLNVSTFIKISTFPLSKSR